MLIRRAEINFSVVVDLRVANGRVAAIAPQLLAQDHETVIEANGAALVPGLRDHHLHLASLAASRSSLRCGPPQVHTAAQLAALLGAQGEGCGWVRGIGYHESVAGEIDRDWIDCHLSNRPVRIQHRGGRLWVLNSLALQVLGVDEAGADPLERIGGRLSGRLYDNDRWLRQRLGRERPNLAGVSLHLASRGVTGLTDASPNNGPEEVRWLRQAQQRGELLQELLVMGDASLDDFGMEPAASDTVASSLRIGPRKFHLHEAHLPDYEQVCAGIRQARQAARNVAFHCVTRAELVYTLGALREAGVSAGDRIEHASVTPPELLEEIRELGLTVVSQPGFVAERGDSYLEAVEADDQPWLYRLRAFVDAGVPLAGSSDAPFAEAEPWQAMQAAVTRRSAAGRSVGAAEALSPEQALALFTSPLDTPGQAPGRVEVGAVADLCLLDAGWKSVRLDLAAARPRLTLRGGQVIWAG
ncbi:amidohydrolase family protein [Nevskia soli]|uniref:amidohydrolase family protein n=1 Tax=Nevskia soli TaxID=418856 RepID=UPI000564EE4C|nr:amidohydrolase family protein [Nevskia soli]